MVYQIRLKPSAKKQLNKTPAEDQKRIYAVFHVLSNNPYIGKKLKGEYSGFYSFRVWPYRIIYSIIKRELLVIIIRIGQRQGVY